MRIIAGEHRGRILAAPPGLGTRPMLDRVREALFGALGARVEEARVLDLFAGTGSLALEALSRGAARARLVERDGRVLKVLSRNLETLGLAERAEVVRADALAPRAWWPAGAEEQRAPWADLAFLDPPYPFLRDARRVQVLDALERIARDVLAPGGLVVLHAPARALSAGDLRGLAARERVYGSSSLWTVEAPEVAP